MQSTVVWCVFGLLLAAHNECMCHPPPSYKPPATSLLTVYCIDGRGRKWLEPAGLVPALQAASVSTVNLTVNRVTTKGKVGLLDLPWQSSQSAVRATGVCAGTAC
jgi:hypothetical protein